MLKVSQKWWVYIVECADNTLYTGISTDVLSRIETHNAGKGAKYTKVRLPVCLKYSEPAESKSLALKREFEIKKLSRLQKQELCKRK